MNNELTNLTDEELFTIGENITIDAIKEMTLEIKLTYKDNPLSMTIPFATFLENTETCIEALEALAIESVRNSKMLNDFDKEMERRKLFYDKTSHE